MLSQATVSAITLRIYRSAFRLLQPAADVRGLLKKASGTLIVALALSTPYGTAQTLHTFTDGTDGGYPFGGLAAGKNGVLYGTTEETVFQLTPPRSMGGAWTESTIYSFNFGFALASPSVGPHGELYGTTYFGGTEGVGTVYKLTPPASAGGTWTETTLYSFSIAVGDPQNPMGGVVIGKNGVLYGTVQFAGTSPACPFYPVSYGCGAVYSLTPPTVPGGNWTEETLYTFQGGIDGAVLYAGVSMGNEGELYGAAYMGGPGSQCAGTFYNPTPGFRPQSNAGCGTVFELDPPASAGGAWTETTLYGFLGGSDGGFPNALLYKKGVLYGTVTFGGNQSYCGGVGCGGVFQLSPPAFRGGNWTEKVIYSFESIPDGLFPDAGLAIGEDGTLYGTTRDGGDSGSCPQNPGCGAVFQLTPAADSEGDWQEEILHTFTATDGWRPTSSVVVGNDGGLYGTTFFGGGTSANCPVGCGVVFKVNPKH